MFVIPVSEYQLFWFSIHVCKNKFMFNQIMCQEKDKGMLHCEILPTLYWENSHIIHCVYTLYNMWIFSVVCNTIFLAISNIYGTTRSLCTVLFTGLIWNTTLLLLNSSSIIVCYSKFSLCVKALSKHKCVSPAGDSKGKLS